MDHEWRDLVRIFMPYAMRCMERAEREKIRFVHYTSADAGMKILRSNQMLLRNSTLMNDFSEVRYGEHCLSMMLESEIGSRLDRALQKVDEDLPGAVRSSLGAFMIDVRHETYLISVSEHDGGLEDEFGRLSMWRAYAPKDGVAFILKNGPFLQESNALQAFTSPVAYTTVDGFQTLFQEVVESIELNASRLKALGRDFVYAVLLNALRFAIQSTKHPAFREEREWRVIYSPTLLQREGRLDDEQLTRIPTEIMSLGGVPQRVYAIPFLNHPDEGFVGATIPELLDRILIGPSQDSYAIAQAFVAELASLNVPEPHTKVMRTDIPLRN